MANQLATAVATISVSTKQFDSALRYVKEKLEDISKKIAKPKIDIDTSALAASTVIWENAINAIESAIHKVVSLLPKAAFAADDLEMSMHRVKVVFQEAKGRIIDTIDELSNIGYARTKVAGLAADMGLMLHGMGIAEKESANLTSQLLKMATEAEVVYGVPLQEFMEKLEASVAGMPRALKRIGINFDEFQVKQEALELVGKHVIAMTEDQQLRWARLNLILKQGAAMTGQAAWAHKTLGGQFRETQGRFHGLLTSFGEIVKPAFIKGFMAINEVLKKLGSEIDANKASIKGWVDIFIEKATTDPIGTIKAIWETIGATVEWIWDGVWDKIVTYGTAAFEYLGHTISVLIGNLAKEIEHKLENIFTNIKPKWGSFADVPGGFLWNAKKFSEFLPKKKESAFKAVGPEPGILAKILGFFEKPLAPIMQFLGKAKAVKEIGGVVPGGAIGGIAPGGVIPGGVKGKKVEFDPKDFRLPAHKLGLEPIPGHEAKILEDRKAIEGISKKRHRLDPRDFQMFHGQAFPLPGHELKVAADKLAMREEKKEKEEKKKKGKRPVEDENEPTPKLPPVRPGMKLGTQASFVGIAEFAKQIQLGALGGQDKQLDLLARIAHSSEYLSQLVERQQAQQKAFAAVAGPN